MGKAPRRKAKQKKHIWRLFGEGPKEKTKKHKKNKKNLVGKPKRDTDDTVKEENFSSHQQLIRQPEETKKEKKNIPS